jgi:predicted dithiol-disulfide oxidoreductase (DUF899 family)
MPYQKQALLLTLSLLTLPAMAEEEARFATIRQLGDLNAVALHCKALPETQRMKQALVRVLPKRRQLGELFDQQTNTAFLRFMEQKANCPSPATLHDQVEQAITALEQAYTGDGETP